MLKKIRKLNDSREYEFCQWRITRILLYTYYYSVMYGTHQTSSRFHRNKANNISSVSTSWKRHVAMENFHFAETTGRAMIIRRSNLCMNNTSANRRHWEYVLLHKTSAIATVYYNNSSLPLISIVFLLLASFNYDFRSISISVLVKDIQRKSRNLEWEKSVEFLRGISRIDEAGRNSFFVWRTLRSLRQYSELNSRADCQCFPKAVIFLFDLSVNYDLRSTIPRPRVAREEKTTFSVCSFDVKIVADAHRVARREAHRNQFGLVDCFIKQWWERLLEDFSAPRSLSLPSPPRSPPFLYPSSGNNAVPTGTSLSRNHRCFPPLRFPVNKYRDPVLLEYSALSGKIFQDRRKEERHNYVFKDVILFKLADRLAMFCKLSRVI